MWVIVGVTPTLHLHLLKIENPVLALNELVVSNPFVVAKWADVHQCRSLGLKSLNEAVDDIHVLDGVNVAVCQVERGVDRWVEVVPVEWCIWVPLSAVVRNPKLGEVLFNWRILDEGCGHCSHETVHHIIDVEVILKLGHRWGCRELYQIIDVDVVLGMRHRCGCDELVRLD